MVAHCYSLEVVGYLLGDDAGVYNIQLDREDADAHHAVKHQLGGFTIFRTTTAGGASYKNPITPSGEEAPRRSSELLDQGHGSCTIYVG